MKKSYAVFGLGRYGLATAKELAAVFSWDKIKKEDIYLTLT